MEVGRRKKRGAKKVKMPRVDFDMETIREIKERKKSSKKAAN